MATKTPHKRSKPPPAPPPPARPTHYDKYLAVEQAIRRDPLKLIEDLRARTVRRGDGSTGPMPFADIADIITDLAVQHATQHQITPVTITQEAVRRWWRHFHPDEPVRRSRTDAPVSLNDLDRTDPVTAARIRQDLGL